MSTLEETIKETIKSFVREALAEEAGATQRLPLPLLDADEAGKLLGNIDRQSVYRLAREGQLRPVHISKTRFRFQVEEIERFIREGGVKNSCLRQVPAPKVSRGGR